MIEISEETVRGLALICGPHSAAARALANAEARRKAGETVTFYKVRGSIIVHGTPAPHALDDDKKGGGNAAV